MRAKAPLDVDLEDKLMYGLTPVRLGYVVLALLGGMTLWTGSWAAPPLRASACVTVIAIGATAAWGRWRGRAADQWLADIASFLFRSHRLVVDRGSFESAWRRIVEVVPRR